MQTILFAIQLLEALPPLLAAGKDVSVLISQGAANIKRMQAEGRDPTEAEWGELHDTVAALRAELHSN